MNCDQDMLINIEMLVDDALPPIRATEVMSHVRQCSNCLANWQKAQALKEHLLQHRASIAVPADLEKSIMAKAAPKPLVSSRFKFPAIAALFLIALGLAGYEYQLAIRPTVTLGTLAEMSSGDVSTAGRPAFDMGMKIPSFPGYRMVSCRSVQLPNKMSLGCFSFTNGEQEFICYQAQEGAFKGENLPPSTVNGHPVRVGNVHDWNFLVWTENNSEHLVMSKMPSSDLLRIVAQVIGKSHERWGAAG